MKLESLFESVPSLSAADRDLIERAYRVAERAHAGQVRASGEPYLQHCLAVAKILADFGVPATTLAAALLHDVVEDSGIPLAEIRRDFGDEIANQVDGVTKLTQLPRVSRAGETNAPEDETEWRRALDVETLRKIFLAMGDDVRVVLIKLADRLHNMRTLGHLDPARRARIAQETLEIFAPLANRLGMWQMKWELEDLAFRHVNPAMYKEIAGKLEERRANREATMDSIVVRLKELLGQSGIQAEITGRPKHIYSIYRKIERKGVPFESLHDIRGVRIIVPDLPSCYVTLGVIHNQWSPLPGDFDDYIASPKDNFYQSLHTAVVYDDGKTLEVQIRTAEMHQNAELGIAAHWRYKEGGKRDESFERRILWLRSLMDWRSDVQDAAEFVDALKSDVFEDRVYVFTPKGDVIDLPAGSTPIDFAYHVHTEIGHHCRGARVNGKLVALDYRVRTGDQVGIITTRSGGPSRDWLNTDLGLVRSQRAIAKIRQYFKRQDQEQRASAGREAVERELRRLGVEDVTIESLAKEFNYPVVGDFLAAVGSGDISSARIVAKILQGEHAALEEMPALSVPTLATTEGVNVTGLRGMLTTMARCCKPVPGDQIVGYVTRGRGATIHRTDCPNILRAADKERLVRVSWGHAARTYPVAVRVTAYDREGLLRDVSTVVGEEHINMNSVVSTLKAHQATIDLILEVTDLGQLSRVMNRIEALPNVVEARRVRA
ncbi:MAG TPA: bifunctional (p)ppGpp synthetase/guanosine-3',5'-bis(diphosphate) 3'-pyrophosphohydrolase [Anaerolineales bacterium]|nr:bifunctional (p)ppGpp synthetase/guanosine-3',5'-bis(diphosphate) 3'-pyrophosphohydrolase [Anaerolineales bacterium]